MYELWEYERVLMRRATPPPPQHAQHRRDVGDPGSGLDGSFLSLPTPYGVGSVIPPLRGCSIGDLLRCYLRSVVPETLDFGQIE